MATTAAHRGQYKEYRGAERRSYKPGSLWWMSLISGIALILMGILLMVSPVQTFMAALFFIGLYAFVVGAVDVIMGIVDLFQGTGYGFLNIVIGALGILLGLLIFKYPVSSASTLIAFTGIWFIISGGIQLFNPHIRVMRARGMQIFSGVLYIIVGLMLFWKPLVNGSAFFWVLGLFALIAGSIRIALAVHLKNISGRIASST